MYSKIFMSQIGKKRELYVHLAVIALYAVLYILISYFHEPWFDEAQAWEIGRCASIKEMLFVLPHTEGHPPLWSLILSIPAKMGIPYLWGLKGIGFVFSVASVALFEFKAPFPNVVKVLYPFSYFAFYQYGVISRTYCVMTLAFMLVAMSFRERNEKPWRFIASLLLLCLTSAYGIAIAGAICLAWCIDIVKEIVAYPKKNVIIKDKRVHSLVFILVCAIILLIEIMPYKNTYAINSGVTEWNALRTAYSFLAMTGDAFVSNSVPMFENGSFHIGDYCAGIIVSIILWALIALFSKKEEIKYYLLPYLAFSVFMSYYMYDHHVGISTLILLFYAWATIDIDQINQRFEWMTSGLGKGDRKFVKKVLSCIPIVLLCFLCFYSVSTSIEEIRYSYSSAEEIADIIKTHGMEDAVIFVSYSDRVDCDDENSDYNVLRTEKAVGIVPYFDRNIFVNHNVANPEKMYSTHMIPSYQKIEEVKSFLIKRGKPEAIIGDTNLDEIYGNICSSGEYVCVAQCEDFHMYKGLKGYGITPIYVRRDCLEKFNYSDVNYCEQ